MTSNNRIRFSISCFIVFYLEFRFFVFYSIHENNRIRFFTGITGTSETLWEQIKGKFWASHRGDILRTVNLEASTDHKLRSIWLKPKAQAVSIGTTSTSGTLWEQMKGSISIHTIFWVFKATTPSVFFWQKCTKILEPWGVYKQIILTIGFYCWCLFPHFCSTFKIFLNSESTKILEPWGVFTMVVLPVDQKITILWD